MSFLTHKQPYFNLYPKMERKQYTFNEENGDKKAAKWLTKFQAGIKPTHVIQAHLLLLKLCDKNIYFPGNIAH